MTVCEAPISFFADLTNCANLSMQTADQVSAIFSAALSHAGATIVETVSHAFPGKGLTCVLILSESHAVLHTWPETGTINVDIFSCTTRLRGAQAIQSLGTIFGARHVAIQESARADGRDPSWRRSA